MTPRAFAKEFAQAFQQGQFEACVGMMSFPLPIIRLFDTVIVESAEDELDLLVKRRAGYQAAGAVHFKYDLSNIREISNGLDMVDFDWTVLNHAGEAISMYSVTHVLRTSSDGYRIAGFINHSEAENRPMFIAASPEGSGQ